MQWCDQNSFWRPFPASDTETQKVATLDADAPGVVLGSDFFQCTPKERWCIPNRWYIPKLHTDQKLASQMNECKINLPTKISRGNLMDSIGTNAFALFSKSPDFTHTVDLVDLVTDDGHGDAILGMLQRTRARSSATTARRTITNTTAPTRSTRRTRMFAPRCATSRAPSGCASPAQVSAPPRSVTRRPGQ